MQDEAKQATEAAYHARATAKGAQAEAEHAKKRSSELQLRCLQLEQQLASLGSEVLTQQNHADERSRELLKWQQSAICPEDRDSIVVALLSFVKGYALLLYCDLEMPAIIGGVQLPCIGQQLFEADTELCDGTQGQ